MTKQIQMDMRGIIRFMLFMVAWDCWSPVGGFMALETFMLAQLSAAETKGIRNRPMAAQVYGPAKMVRQEGWSPRLRPRKLKSTFSRPSTLPARSACSWSQFWWARLVSWIS